MKNKMKRILLPLIALSIYSCGDSSKDSEQLNSTTEVDNLNSVSYEVVKKEDISTGMMYNGDQITNKRFTYRILVSPEIQQFQVEPTIKVAVKDITSKDSDIDELHLLLYSDKTLIDGPFDVAMADWAPKNEITPEIAMTNDRTGYEIKISVKENLEESLKQKSISEEKFGLTEEKRREIYRDLYSAEIKAREEADKIFPVEKEGNIDKNSTKNRELMLKYQAEVREKHNIDEDTQWAIIEEAMNESWSNK